MCHTVVLPDREILVKTLDRWDNSGSQSYIINSGSDDCIRLEQDIYKGDDFCLYDAELWPIYASTLSIDLTRATHKNFSFIDHSTDNPELNGKEQSFSDLVDAMKNNEVNLEHTRIWLAEDEFSYTTVMVQRVD